VSSAPPQTDKQPDEVADLRARAEQGDAEAQDYTQAVLWFCRAVDEGHTDALFQLGVMYAFGRAVRQDLVEAFMWMHLAASRATCRREKKRYRHGRTAVANWLTRTQMAEARKIAAAWAEAFEKRQKK
jgi:TPR repeat protein